jgi:hypothetical protein
LFGQKSLHPLIRFRFQPMDECEHLTAAFSWQALAHHDLKPPFLPRRCVGGLVVPAIDADRAQWISLRQTKFIESRRPRQLMVGYLVETFTDSRHMPLPGRYARRMLQGKYGAQDAGGDAVRQQSGELCLEIWGPRRTRRNLRHTPAQSPAPAARKPCRSTPISGNAVHHHHSMWTGSALLWPLRSRKTSGIAARHNNINNLKLLL